MEPNESYPGFAPSSYGAPEPVLSPVPSPPQFRPLSTGEVLDRTFTLYRQRFWLFAGIGMLPAGVLLLSSAARLLFLTMTHRTDALRPAIGPQPTPVVMGSMVALQAYFLPATLLFFVAYGISHAATVDAVIHATQGASTTVQHAYRAVMGRWLRWCGIVLRQFWSAIWPILPGIVVLFGSIAMITAQRASGNVAVVGLLAVLGWCVMVAGVVMGILNFIRNTLAVAAGVYENLGVNASMRRSRMLVAGHKGRIFLTLLLVYTLQMVVAAVQVPLLFAAVNLRGGAFIAVQAIAMLVQFAAVMLVTPIASIAFTLFYIDERVRREGLDIEVLMRHTLPPLAVPPIVEI